MRRSSWWPLALGLLWGMGSFQGCTSLPPPESRSSGEFGCATSRPLLIKGQDTGFLECKSTGLMHRVRASVCPTFLPRDAAAVKQAIGWDAARPEGFECQSDEECKAKINGECKRNDSGVGSSCVYGCRADVDCAADQLCLCDDPVGRCVHALCRTDEQCEGAAVCGEYVPKDDCNGSAFACQTPNDECVGKSCWTAASEPVKFCTLDENRRRVCSKDVTCSEH